MPPPSLKWCARRPDKIRSGVSLSPLRLHPDRMEIIPVQNVFTPFLPDALGAPAPAQVSAGPLHFIGENKRRAEAKPSRTIIISMLAAGFLTLFAASALAVQSLVELDRSFKAELV